MSTDIQRLKEENKRLKAENDELKAKYADSLQKNIDMLNSSMESDTLQLELQLWVQRLGTLTCALIQRLADEAGTYTVIQETVPEVVMLVVEFEGGLLTEQETINKIKMIMGVGNECASNLLTRLVAVTPVIV